MEDITFDAFDFDEDDFNPADFEAFDFDAVANEFFLLNAINLFTFDTFLVSVFTPFGSSFPREGPPTFPAFLVFFLLLAKDFSDNPEAD